MQTAKNDPKLMESVCTLLNNLVYKNTDTKKGLGEKGALEWIIELFGQYSNTNKVNVIKPCLKIIGNLSLIKENALKFIECGFIKKAVQMIETNKNNVELIKIILAVIGNLAIEDQNGSIAKMLNDGAVSATLLAIETHELNCEVANCAIDTVGNFIKNENHCRIIGDQRGIEVCLKILKRHDYNKDVIAKTIRVLSDLLIHENNVVILVNLNGCSILNGIIVAQKNEYQIIKNVFKIYNRIAN